MFKSTTTLTTVVGESTTIDGKVTTKSAVRVDGTINGDVDAVSGVIVSEAGEINGNIHSPGGKVTIEGILKGNVNANILIIRSKAKVTGQIDVKNISIEGGAIVNSTIQMDLDPLDPSKKDSARKSS